MPKIHREMMFQNNIYLFYTYHYKHTVAIISNLRVCNSIEDTIIPAFGPDP